MYSKYELLQERALQALKYALQNEKVLNNNTKKPYTQTELADALNVERSLITHILNGRRIIELTKIEKIERIIGLEIYTVLKPEILIGIEVQPKKKDNSEGQKGDMMGGKFISFDFYPKIVQKIISIIHDKYPELLVEVRDKSQYVSLNIFGNLVRESILKDNLHLLFFKYIEINDDPLLKIEFMISNERLKKLIQDESWFVELNKYHSQDNASVTDFIDGKAIINQKRPVFKISELSDFEIESIGKLALSVFEIQCGLY